MPEWIPWSLVPWGLLLVCLIDLGAVLLDRRLAAGEKFSLLFQERFVYLAAATALAFYFDNKKIFAIALPIFAIMAAGRIWKSVRR